jgi:hypothetical protein
MALAMQSGAHRHDNRTWLALSDAGRVDQHIQKCFHTRGSSCLPTCSSSATVTRRAGGPAGCTTWAVTLVRSEGTHMVKSKLKVWGALVAAVAATLVVMSSATAAASAPPVTTPISQIQTANAASPNAISIRFSVSHTGLFVHSATVTNISGPLATPTIINEGNHAVHVGSEIGAGKSYTVGFNRDVANGDTICGQVGNSPQLCIQLGG